MGVFIAASANVLSFIAIVGNVLGETSKFQRCGHQLAAEVVTSGN